MILIRGIISKMEIIEEPLLLVNSNQCEFLAGTPVELMIWPLPTAKLEGADNEQVTILPIGDWPIVTCFPILLMRKAKFINSFLNMDILIPVLYFKLKPLFSKNFHCCENPKNNLSDIRSDINCT